jgi:nucleoside-diphosphate-sugar epimerase
MRVLVTGGRGFIGSELLPIIQNAAHDVYSLERHPANSAEQSENRGYRIKEGDIIKTSQIRHIIREIQPEILIQLAVRSALDFMIGFLVSLIRMQEINSVSDYHVNLFALEIE